MNLSRSTLLADFLVKSRNENLKQFQKTVDSLLEGVQIHDFNWTYIYVNDALAVYSHASKEALIGSTLMDVYPGIETSDIFKILQECMTCRVPRHLETEFTFPNGVTSFFELSIQPIPEGLFILSIDKTEQKNSREKLLKVNRLYAFTSAINQSIVHITDEKSLLEKSCEIAVNIGQFSMAYIGKLDDNNRLQLVSFRGDKEAASKILQFSEVDVDDPKLHDLPVGKVFRTGKYFCINDVQSDPSMENWKDVLNEHGLKSNIALPLVKFGEVIGIMGLHSGTKGFFDEEELPLLIEAADDISFALENIERSQKHKEAEERIVKYEKRFRALIEKSSDMKTLSTLEGIIMYGSPAITRVLGYEISEFLHRPATDFLHPEEIPEIVKKRLALVNEPGKYFEFNYRFLHKNGNWLWCEGTITNMLHEPGVNAFLSNFRDVSAKKIAEEKLLKSEEFNKGILRSLTAHVAVIDMKGDIIAVNEAWDRFSRENGQTLLTLTGVGSNYFEVCERSSKLGDTHASEVLEGLKDVLEERKQIYYLEYPCHSPGKLQWFAMRVTKFDSEKPMAVVTHQDITERKLSEQVLIHSNEELRKANYELDRFVYSASHDLRSPLTTILGVLNIIEGESNEANILNYASMIRSSVNRLDGVIKNIINYSKNNRIPLENNLIPLEKTLKAICKLKQTQIELEGIQLEIDVTDEVPFRSDFKRFEIIVQNILTNAIKFCDHSKLESHIWITAKTNPDYLQLVIADNGIGIAKEYHHKIFEMFFRLSGKIPGSGIGLYIVSEAIEKLKGSIKVDSTLGKGSEFLIMIPNLKP